jgi:hypothetical protein
LKPRPIQISISLKQKNKENRRETPNKPSPRMKETSMEHGSHRLVSHIYISQLLPNSEEISEYIIDFQSSR